MKGQSVRSICLLTILALLYCPLACVAGQGYGVGSQLGDGQETETTACCCCAKRSTTVPTNSGNPESQEKDCQGICNGAVHERHDVSIDLPELAHIAAYPAFPDLLVDRSAILRKHAITLPDEHVLSGRQLRTFLLALTC